MEASADPFSAAQPPKFIFTPPPLGSGIITLIFVVFFTTPSYSEEKPRHWHEPFFIEGSYHQYFTPELFADLASPDPGFRAAFGYEHRRFRFALESGYSHITGENPLVLGVSMAPLVFKAGYAQPIIWGFGIQADAGFGVLFSRITHYDTAINMLTDNKRYTDAASPLATGRLYATYTFLRNSLKVYAGGGLDAMFETESTIPLPVLEIGLSFKPFTFISRGKNGSAPAEKPVETAPAQEAAQDALPGLPPPIVKTVYFRENTAEMFEEYFPVLDEAGRLLAANPRLSVTLRGYSAPSGTEEQQLLTAKERAEFCAGYLASRHGIAPERLTVEYYGGGGAHEYAEGGAAKSGIETGEWEFYRCAELEIK